MGQDTNAHQKHRHCSMWKPRIPLHQHLDTEYVSILNSPPALCSVKGIKKRRSSCHTMVVQINTTKGYIHVTFHTHNSITKIRISHSIQKSISALNFKNKIKSIFNLKFKVKFHSTPASPQQSALSLPGPTGIS